MNPFSFVPNVTKPHDAVIWRRSPTKQSGSKGIVLHYGPGIIIHRILKEHIRSIMQI
jgi:hypothetical protein